MTTIAYKDGVFAYDSRITSGSTIVDDEANKMTERDGHVLFCTGATPDIENLIELYCGRPQDAEDISANALAITNGVIYFVGWNKTDGLWKSVVGAEKIYSIGSGSDHAWTAMDCGKSAAEAVELAKKRDSGTGGEVRTYRVPV